MADKSIGDLNFAPGTVDDSNTLFVVQQAGAAYKLSGHNFILALTTILDGHGGVKSITYDAPVSPSLTGTMTITLADDSTTTVSVTNGKGITSIAKVSTADLVDTYRISYNDNTTQDFTVTNGAKGDTGDAWYVWIRYAGQRPTSDSDIGTVPDDWIGIYSGTASTAPTSYTAYSWYEYKGEKGDTGTAASITQQSVTYQESASGTVAPSGSWVENIPSVTPGNFLWTRTVLEFNDGTSVTSYSVSRYGIDGTGAVSTVNNIAPDTNGNIALPATGIPASDNQSVQAHITAAEADIDDLQTDVGTLQDDMTTAQGQITDLNAVISDVKSNVAFVEDGDTATQAIDNWRYVIWKGNLYISTQSISIGTTLSNSNLTAVNNGGLNALGAINDASLVAPSGIITTITPAKGSNYEAYGGSYFYKVGTLVHVHIGLSGITANANNDIFALPVGYRPYTQVGVAGNAGTSYTAHCHIAVLDTGVIRVSSTDTYAIGDIEFHAFN